MNSQIEAVKSNDLIRIHLGTRIENVDGFIGNFKTELYGESAAENIAHGVVILATGAREHQTGQYLCGEHPAVVTQLGLDQLFNKTIRACERHAMSCLSSVWARANRTDLTARKCAALIR